MPTVKGIYQNGFIENKGQIVDQNYKSNPNVLYLFCSPGFNIQLRKNGFSYDTYSDVYDTAESIKTIAGIPNDSQEPVKFTRNYHRIDIDLLNCNGNAELLTEGPSEAYLNYFTAGTPKCGISKVHYFTRVTYKNIYPNIDLEFSISKTAVQNNPGVEYNFIVHPGGKVSDIKLSYKGAKKVNLSDGKLTVEVSSGTFNENIPASYISDTKEPVQVNYASLGNNIYGFSVSSSGSLPLNSDLIIDPNPCLNWGTYYGGSGGGNQSNVYGMALGSSDTVLITGFTSSTANIATAGSYITAYPGGSSDGYIAKLNPTGTAVKWATYFGGTGQDAGYGIAVDGSGNCYVAGYSTSTGLATGGAFNTSGDAANGSAFVAKFNSTGTALTWYTYYGSTTKTDKATAIAIDGASPPNVYITGWTQSTTGIKTAGAHQTALAGASDAFVAKFNSSGTALTWGTYYGGTALDEAFGIALDAANNVYITGATQSTTGIASAGAYSTSLVNAEDAFVAEISSTGATLTWGTYFNVHSVIEFGSKAIAVSGGKVYITGSTFNVTSGIATAGSFQAATNNTTTALPYVAEFNPALAGAAQLVWGTYYGGEKSAGIGQGIAVDASANVYVTGYVGANDTMATAGAYQTANAGGNDVFVGMFNPSLSGSAQLVWGTFYGGPNTDAGQAIALDASNNVFIAGYTTSASGIATAGTYRTTYGGTQDGFVAEFGCTVLPIQLVNFSGYNNGSENVLQWQTATEIDNSYFTLEHASNAIDFTPFATVKGAGNSDHVIDYSAIDYLPPAATTYYRLKQTDYDGNSTYSSIIAINSSATANGLNIENIYPNPSNGNFQYVIDCNQAEPVIVNVIDVLGRIIYSQNVSINEGQNSLHLDVSFLNKGAYLLEVETTDETQKNVKQLLLK
jgi:hypothetical protein